MRPPLLILAFVLAIYASAPADTPKAVVPDAPSDLSEFEGYQGKTLHFMVLGILGGHVWGTDVYTLDSTVAAAAVHAGAVKLGEPKEVVILMLPGQTSYRGSERNGRTTNDFAEYRGSYRFLKPGEAEPDLRDGKHPLRVADNLAVFKPRMGETLFFTVTGSADGKVWGSGPYTADSNLAAAAVHAGMVKPGETEVLRVTILPGEEQYSGSESHGIVSGDYGEFELGFRFEPKPTENIPAKEAAKSRTTDSVAPKKP